jgi:hypothetical protein
LVKPIEIVLNENVMPWIMEKMMEFMMEDDYVVDNAEEIMGDAFSIGRE